MTRARPLAAAALLLIAALASPVAAQPKAGWSLQIPERLELVAGAGGALPITVTVERGLSLSKDAGVILDLAPDAAIGVKRRRLGRTDAVDPDADAPKFSVALRADTAGDFQMRVRLRGWLCGQKACRPIEARRNVTIAVTPPPASPPPAPSVP